jgi:hypothetical protein
LFGAPRALAIIAAIMGAMGVPIAAMIAIPIMVFIMAMAAWAAATPQLEGTSPRIPPKSLHSVYTIPITQKAQIENWA